MAYLKLHPQTLPLPKTMGGILTMGLGPFSGRIKRNYTDTFQLWHTTFFFIQNKTPLVLITSYIP